MPGDGRSYTVIETLTGQFRDNWNEAVQRGYLNPGQAANDLEWLKLTLGRDPYQGTLADGDFWVLSYQQPGWRIDFWYHVIEDDRIVELTAVTWRLR